MTSEQTLEWSEAVRHLHIAGGEWQAKGVCEQVWDGCILICSVSGVGKLRLKDRGCGQGSGWWQNHIGLPRPSLAISIFILCDLEAVREFWV